MLASPFRFKNKSVKDIEWPFFPSLSNLPTKHHHTDCCSIPSDVQDRGGGRATTNANGLHTSAGRKMDLHLERSVVFCAVFKWFLYIPSNSCSDFVDGCRVYKTSSEVPFEVPVVDFGMDQNLFRFGNQTTCLLHVARWAL